MVRTALVQIASSSLLCLSMAAAVNAQASKPEQTRKSDQTVTTIVGCLVQGNPAGVGAESRSERGTASADDYFVRTPTVAIPIGTTITVGKPGSADTTTSAGQPSKDSFYRITGLTGDQLQPHVGHRVELRGHLSGNVPDAAAGGNTTAKTTVDQTGRATTTVEKRVDVAGVLHATTIKMVGESCR